MESGKYGETKNFLQNMFMCSFYWYFFIRKHITVAISAQDTNKQLNYTWSA